MWKRFKDRLRCPLCGNNLQLDIMDESTQDIEQRWKDVAVHEGIDPGNLNQWVETGIFLCDPCHTWYPVTEGLPVMLPYATEDHKRFRLENKNNLSSLGKDFHPPDQEPPPGEEFVRKTFSAEWNDYSYDDILWTWSYEERERIFMEETGINDSESDMRGTFIEIGCGLGVVTSFAQKHFKSDAVGMDISAAVMKANLHFRNNPFLHFVRASLWRLPFEEETFDVVYSHGVIHHTYSTEKAFKKIASLCSENGLLYLWIYGQGSIKDSLIRRSAYLCESLVRPLLARMPPGLSMIFLLPVSIAYMAANRIQRLTGQKRQPYDFRRALHAARDRFTPLYAHRANYPEVEKWFKEAGFYNLDRVRYENMSPGISDTFRRNIGLRGIKKR